jgi:hypothetical protein
MRSFASLCILLGLGAGFVAGQQIFDVVRGPSVVFQGPQLISLTVHDDLG